MILESLSLYFEFKEAFEYKPILIHYYQKHITQKATKFERMLSHVISS